MNSRLRKTSLVLFMSIRYLYSPWSVVGFINIPSPPFRVEIGVSFGWDNIEQVGEGIADRLMNILQYSHIFVQMSNHFCRGL